MVNTQDELNLMENEAFLTLHFTEYNAIIIEIRDGQYRGQFYVPTIKPSNGKSLKLIFDRKSSWSAHVNFNGRQLEVTNAKKLVLVNSGGKWEESNGMIVSFKIT